MVVFNVKYKQFLSTVTDNVDCLLLIPARHSKCINVTGTDDQMLPTVGLRGKFISDVS